MTPVFVRLVSADFQNHPTPDKPDHIFEFTLEYAHSDKPKIVGRLAIPVAVNSGSAIISHSWENAALTLEAAAAFTRKIADGQKAPPKP